MEITYHREGDYLIPDLTLPENSGYNIGKFGMLRQEYIMDHRRGLYINLLLSGELWEYLSELNEECHEVLDRIIPGMMEKEGVTEELKAADQMKWVQMRNNIQHRAEEFILHDYIFV